MKICKLELPAWTAKYLLLLTSKKEKKGFLKILKMHEGYTQGLSTFSIGQYMRIDGYIANNTKYELYMETVVRIGSHLLSEGKVTFSDRNQLWRIVT